MKKYIETYIHTDNTQSRQQERKEKKDIEDRKRDREKTNGWGRKTEQNRHTTRNTDISRKEKTKQDKYKTKEQRQNKDERWEHTPNIKHKQTTETGIQEMEDNRTKQEK